MTSKAQPPVETTSTKTRQQLTERQRKVLVVVWVLAAMASLLFLWKFDAKDSATSSLVKLQITGDPDTAQAILNDLSPTQFNDLVDVLDVDGWFIPTYVLSLGLLAAWSVGGYRNHLLRRSGPYVLAATVAAGLLDVIENAALRTFLTQRTEAWPSITAAASWPKLVLLFAVGILATLGLLLRARSGLQWLIRGTRIQHAMEESVDSERERADFLPMMLSQALPQPDQDRLLSHRLRPPWATHWDPEPNKLGICCSGGGIRSAAFNLGALQALQSRGEFKRARFLSAVSGGSYIAAAHSIIENDTVDRTTFDRKPAYGPGSPEEHYLRNRSSYLAPGFLGKLRIVGRVLIGLFVNLMFLWLLLLLLSRPLGWLLNIDQLYPSFKASEFEIPSHLWLTAAWPAALSVGVATYAVLRRFRYQRQYRLYVNLAFALLALSGTILALFILVPWLGVAIPNLVQWLIEKVVPGETDATKPQARVVLLILNALGVTTLGAALGRVLSKHTSRLARYAVGFIFPLAVTITFVLLVRDAGRAGKGSFEVLGLDLGHQIWGLLAIATLLIAFYAVSDQTTWSMHPYYKQRLSSVFAVRRVSDDEVEPLPYDELALLSKYRPRCTDSMHDCTQGDHADEHCDHRCSPWPELVVCAAANVTDEGATPTGRNASSFTFSSNEIGGPDVGWIRTKEMEQALGEFRREDITLPAAVAIAGAAISPGMGKKTPAGVGALLAISNARLGVWLPNPQWVKACAQKNVVFRERARVSYLIKEILRRFRRDDPFLYVTDGGHWENLGLVELMRRGCTEIYCFDASGDSVDTYFTLGEAVAIARTELGIDIRIDPRELRQATRDTQRKSATGRTKKRTVNTSDSETTERVESGPPVTKKVTGSDGKQDSTEGQGSSSAETTWKERPEMYSSTDHVLATFAYTDKDKTQGRIAFAKTAITEHVPWDVKAYAEKDPSFPTHSTADQLYKDERFEAYRALGWYTALRAVDSLKNPKPPES